MLKKLGVAVTYYDPLVGAGIADLIQPNTRVVFTESPGSNTFEIQDIPAISKAAKAAGAVVMMDNTWATPVYFRPLDHGVDISIHAATKYPAGHSDVLLGTVSASERCWAKRAASSGDDSHLSLAHLPPSLSLSLSLSPTSTTTVTSSPVESAVTLRPPTEVRRSFQSRTTK